MRLNGLDTDGFCLLELTRDGTAVVHRRGPTAAALAEVARTNHPDEATAEAALDEAVQAAQRAGARPAIEVPAVCRAFFETELFALLAARAGEPRPTPGTLRARIEADHGMTCPPDLAALLDFADRYPVGSVVLGEWRLGDLVPPEPVDPNRLASAIALDREHYLGTAVVELLAGLVPVGSAGNGDVYFALLDPQRPDGCEVFLWDHETRDLEPFADGLPTLAYLNWLYEVDGESIELADEPDGEAAVVARLPAVTAHIQPSWHYRDLLRGAECTWKGADPVPFLYYRAQWIDRLTSARGGGDVAVRAKQALFPVIEGWHARMPAASALTGPRAERCPSAVYWLFYYLFFDHPAELAQAVTTLARSRSAVARDAAALFAPVITGGEALGPIEGVAALVARFRATESPAQEKARLEAAAAAREAARPREVAHGEALIAAHPDPEALLAQVPTLLDRPDALAPVLAHLATVHAGVAATLRRVEVLGDGGRYREHDAAAEWLAAHGERRLAAALRVQGSTRAAGALTQPLETKAVSEAVPFTAELATALPQAAARDALYALVDPDRPADAATARAALGHLDAVLARRRGQHVASRFERTLRAALAERAGEAPDWPALAAGLRYASSDLDRTTQIQRVALEVLARRGTPGQVAAAVGPFLAWMLAPVRAQARAAAAAAGVAGTPRILDTVAAGEVVAAGLDAVCAALADPWARPLHGLIAAAAAAFAGDDLEVLADAAIAAFEARHFGFTEGEGYYSGRYGEVIAAAQAIAALPGPAVAGFIHRMLTHPGPLLRPILAGAAFADRARTVGPLERPPGAPVLPTRGLGPAPRSLGCAVHGIALAGERLLAVGAGHSAAFDGLGTPTPMPAEIRAGHAYDVDVHPDGRTAAVGYHAGHVVVLDLANLSILKRFQLGGVPHGVRKLKFSPSGRYLATGSDDRTLRVLDLATDTEVLRHAETADVNGVAWLDEDTLAFATDRHLGTRPRVGGEAHRVAVGGAADVVVHGGRLLAGTGHHGLAFFDPATLAAVQRVPLRAVARSRVAADGTVWAACYEGEDAGLWRWAPGAAAAERLGAAPLFALDLDPVGGVVAGGRAGEVLHFDAQGQPRAAGPVHAGRIAHLAHEAADAPESGRKSAASTGTILALDSTGRVLRWPLAGGLPSAPWPRAPVEDAQAFAVRPDGTLVVAAFKSVAAVAPDGAVRWHTPLARSEALLAGDAVVVGDGPRLTWLDPATGERLASVPARVKSSWVARLLRLDGDSFLVLGYDDPRIARWRFDAQVPDLEAIFDVRHPDGRYARTYGVALGPTRLFTAHWNETVAIIDPSTLAVEATLELPASYAVLAVDATERTLWAAVGAAVHRIEVATGALLGVATLPAEVTALLAVGDAVVAGLATGGLWRVG